MSEAERHIEWDGDFHYSFEREDVSLSYGLRVFFDFPEGDILLVNLIERLKKGMEEPTFDRMNKLFLNSKNQKSCFNLTFPYVKGIIPLNIRVKAYFEEGLCWGKILISTQVDELILHLEPLFMGDDREPYDFLILNSNLFGNYIIHSRKKVKLSHFPEIPEKIWTDLKKVYCNRKIQNRIFCRTLLWEFLLKGHIYPSEDNRIILSFIVSRQDRDVKLEKTHSLELIASGIAHDFNNQLSGILNYTRLVMDKVVDEELNTYLSEIESAALRTGELTGRLLAFSRQGNYDLSAIDIHKLINHSLEYIVKSEGIAGRLFTSALCASHFHVFGDRGQISNLLKILILNSLDAIGGMEQGNIRINSQVVTLTGEEKLLLPLPMDGEFLSISVIDNGAGMSKDVYHKIFDPFFTTKGLGHGHGMSLPAALGILENHQGNIRFTSKKNQGTSFEFFLPLVEAVSPITKETNMAEPKIPRDSLIMVVDDEEMVLKVTCIIISKLGFRPLSFSSSTLALEYYEEHHQEIDLVLLDMIMPDMNGKQLFLSMKKIEPKVKAILLSGWIDEEENENINDIGLSHFLHKPVEKSVLEKNILRVLSESK